MNEVMFTSQRAQSFLNIVGLQPPQPIPKLLKPAAQDFGGFLPSSRAAARSLLIQQRTSDPTYRAPERKKRNFFKTKKQVAALSNQENWTFTKHEVARAFDSLLSTEPLPPVGTAQALLSHAPSTSLDELWRHLHDTQLEKRTKRRSGPVSASFPPSEMTWLNTVTDHDTYDYMQLLCQNHVGQGPLDRAFGVGLSRYSIESMKMLLSFGADASSYQEAIKDHMGRRQLPLVGLLLSAPNSMTTAVWRACLEQEVSKPESGEEISLDILLICLANRQDLVCESLLLGTLRAQNIPATAITLAYTGSNGKFSSIRQDACQLVCLVQDDGRRLAFFSLLAQSELVADGTALCAELLKNVKARHQPLVRILVQSGVTVDAQPHDSLHWAISQLDFPMIELLKSGVFCSPASRALSHAPGETSEADMVRLLGIFGPMGVTGEILDMLLVDAVQKKRTALVEALVQYGASVEYNNAAAIRIAISAINVDTLNLLLRKDCSPEVLSSTVPVAMVAQPRSSRLQLMQALLDTGVFPQQLGIPLQNLVSEDGDLDSKLIQLLLASGAPVDLTDDLDRNPLLVAARRGDIPVLDMLCNAGPRATTLAAAVPIAFRTMDSLGYGVALDMVTMLMRRGAIGLPPNQTLLEAVTRDLRLDIVRVLLEHGADANFSSGRSFVVAIRARNSRLLGMLYARCTPNRESLSSILPEALDTRYYNLETLQLVLTYSPAPLVLEVSPNLDSLLRGHPNLAEIIPCFLRYGWPVDIGNGLLLCLAIQIKDLDLLCILLASFPALTSLTNAFQEAILVEPRSVKLEMWRFLLEAACSAEIGQSSQVLSETHLALVGEEAGLSLLVHHQADVDTNEGKALEEAAAAGSYAVCHILLSSEKAAKSTLDKAFTAASKSALSPATKRTIFHRLLSINDGVSPDSISKALVDAVASHPGDTIVPQLLLSYGAKVNSAALRSALDSSRDLFELLVKSISGSLIAQRIFRHVRTTEMDAEKRHWAYNHILRSHARKLRERRSGLFGFLRRSDDSEQVEEALLDSLRAHPGNLDIPNLLLEYGASIGYKDCEAFTLAIQSNSIDLVRLLCRFLVNRRDGATASIAFDALQKHPSLEPDFRAAANISLLQCSIEKASLYNALENELESRQLGVSFVRLLMENGADPNENDAHCFSLACKKDAKAEFRAMSKRADLKLLGVLLEYGLSASAKSQYSVRAGWEAEECTALIWALASKPKVDNKVILRLLEGGQSEPEYTTPKTEVSAVFLCLLDKTRGSVLKALLALGNNEVLDTTISGSTFSRLAASSTKSKQGFSAPFDEEDEISPREASLFLGNLDAFRLVTHGEADSETLHLAALLALPNFVRWLLETHDPNYASEAFDSMVPLALACSSQPFSCCKIANEEASWNVRLKETMELLAPKTRADWRLRQMSVLHFALEKGPVVTKAMVEALNISHGVDGYQRYMYTDRTGAQYTPSEYVSELLEIDFKEKRKILECLEGHGVAWGGRHGVWQRGAGYDF
ncbi:hypothetical protein ACJZ2D_003711 [Fusarium nematophilum]